MQTNADGSSVMVWADGTRVKKRADGGVHEIQHTDGSVVHKGADGSTTTHHPDGHSTIAKVHQPSASVHAWWHGAEGGAMQADGTVVTHLGDGDAVKTAPDGSVVAAAQFGRFEDGTQVCEGCDAG